MIYFLRKVVAFIIKYNQFFLLPYMALCYFGISLFYFKNLAEFAGVMYLFVICLSGYYLFATIKLAISKVRQKRADKINNTLRKGGEK